MLRWLRGLFRSPDRFRIPSLSRPLPSCRIRVYEDRDFETCTKIYRLNEPGRFPEGYLDEFMSYLRKKETLIFLCEVDGDICGLGGVGVYLGMEDDNAFLSYGMVEPRYHGQGYGTVLLLVRLSVLPMSVSRNIYLSPVKTSTSFYRRFGFQYAASYRDHRGFQHKQYGCYLYPEDVVLCRHTLTTASIEYPHAKIPAAVPRLPDDS